MRYFIPEWDDRVDPDYDFMSDTHSQLHTEDPINNDAYMWDLFGIDNVPFDGVLVSIATIQKKSRKYSLIEKNGIHTFLGLPDNFPVMGDCGAFSYISDPVPPYSTSEVLKTYVELGFNYGVSVDHLVVSGFADQKEERMRITFQNGLDAYEEWKKKYHNDFQLIVAVQGANTADYLRMYNKFIDKGITSMALGGLVRSPTSDIVHLIDQLIHEIKTSQRAPEYLHFFGIARSQLFYKINELEELGIEVTFDSASYLRRAWLTSPETQGNYITQDHKGYTAIRIPKILSGKKKGLAEQEDVERLGNVCLEALRRYDHEEIGLPDVMNSLKNFNNLIHGKPEYLDYYQTMLEDKPWQSCPCPICQKVGIEVAIFRGNNRNRRRGFHNTISFYHILQNKELWGKQYLAKEITSLDTFAPEGRVLVITGCTKNKCELPEGTTIAAKDLYQGTLFKKVRFFCERKGYDYRILSAKFGLLGPEDQIPKYDQMLKNKQDIAAIKPSVEHNLKELLSDYDIILVIAGKNYREVMGNIIDERFVIVKSRGIGDLLHIVSVATLPKNKIFDPFN